MSIARVPSSWDKRRDGVQLFTKPGVKLDKEMWFSVTPEKIALQIATTISAASNWSDCHIPELEPIVTVRADQLNRDSQVVLDLCAGVGGNTIQFARHCGFVIAVDILDQRLQDLQHNSSLYSCADFIDCVIADAHRSPFRPPSNVPKPLMSQTTATRELFDVAFISPPWGGPKYASLASVSLEPWMSLGRSLHTSRMSRSVVFYLPRNIEAKEVQSVIGLGGVIQAHLQRSAVSVNSSSSTLDLFHRQSTYRSTRKFRSGNSERRRRLKEFSNSPFYLNDFAERHGLVAWNWKPTALTLCIGDIGMRSLVEQNLFEDVGIERSLEAATRHSFQRVQGALTRKAVRGWTWRLVDLIGTSGKVLGQREPETINYELVDPSLDRVDSLLLLSKLNKRMVETIVDLIVEPPVGKDRRDKIGAAVRIVIRYLFKFTVNYLWVILPPKYSNDADWLVSSLRCNLVVEDLNKWLEKCLIKILVTQPKKL